VTNIAIIGESLCAKELIDTIKKHGKNTKIISIFVPEHLPEIIDDLNEVRNLIPPEVFTADVVLDYSKHIDFPAVLRDAKKVISTAKSTALNTVSVECFCSTDISDEFGVPEFKIEIEKEQSNGKTKNKIRKIDVIKSSPCGAAYFLADTLTGMSVEEAVSKVAITLQVHCKGSGGPLGSIHKAAEIHKAAFLKALLKSDYNMF